jgi:tRNA pseudouridine32 synthase/23S rRNA pseudouridine746 synthase
MSDGEVLWDNAAPIRPSDAYRPHTRVFYYRTIEIEPAFPLPAEILFQDDVLLVADKPHFMPVTPGGRYVQRSLLVQLKRMTGIDQLSPIHRIDRETAGLVVFCKQAVHRDAYQALFRDRLVDKTYLALAPWRLALETPRTHESRLIRDDAFFRSIETHGTPNSRTHIQMISRHGNLALYQLKPITGQRHQLRVHMNALQAPIVGDRFYPDVLETADQAPDFDHPLQLLAQHISFTDPVTQTNRAFTSAQHLTI